MSASRFEISWRNDPFHRREPGTSDIPSFAKFIYTVRRFARWPCYADLSLILSLLDCSVAQTDQQGASHSYLGTQSLIKWIPSPYGGVLAEALINL
jgi:hypothetical protein